MRLLKVPDTLLLSWYRQRVDGKAFSAMSDDDLRKNGVDQPLIRQLRNASRDSLQKSKSSPEHGFDDPYVQCYH